MQTQLSRRNTMNQKTKTTLKLASVAMIFCWIIGVNNAIAGQNTIYNLKVTIPFSSPNGSHSPAKMSFDVPTGTYYITLQVDRASWDKPGVADLVPIGLGANGGWKTGLGFVATKIHISGKSQLSIKFSTLAPAGARGRLKITRL
jgi:hypothetical protein